MEASLDRHDWLNHSPSSPSLSQEVKRVSWGLSPRPSWELSVPAPNYLVCSPGNQPPSQVLSKTQQEISLSLSLEKILSFGRSLLENRTKIVNILFIVNHNITQAFSTFPSPQSIWCSKHPHEEPHLYFPWENWGASTSLWNFLLSTSKHLSPHFHYYCITTRKTPSPLIHDPNFALWFHFDPFPKPCSILYTRCR